ncbi:hypothetical protein RIF29_09453 [Crotalaria pallida]|uniref:Transmembrane protein n=1 Tax=Crotalaria pallida TaxID=3830 RepID=A0AAN9FRV6_CROPI
MKKRKCEKKPPIHVLHCRFSVQVTKFLTLSKPFLLSFAFLWRIRQGCENLTHTLHKETTCLVFLPFLTFLTFFLCRGVWIFLPKFEAFPRNLPPR